MARSSGSFKAVSQQDPEALLKALARSQERFASVAAIGRAVGSTLDLDEVLRLVIERTSQALHAERSTLFLIDRERSELWSKVVQGEGLKEIRMPLGSGIAGWACVHDQPVLHNDAKADERFNRTVDHVTGFKTRSMVVAPLHDMTGAVLGAIQALNRVDGDFAAEDLSLLEAIAAQAGVAIENARLFQEQVVRNAELTEAKEALAESVSELDLLWDIERRISDAHSLEDVVDSILAKAIAVLGVEAGSILTLEEESGCLYFKSALGPRSEQLKTVRLEMGEGIAGKVAQSGEPILTNEAAKHPAFASRVARQIDVRARAVLCVPLSGESGVIGALELINPKREKSFEEHDLRVASLIAGQVSRAIALARERVAGERSARLAAIGQMLSGVLHDLRTPMTLVSGYAEMMVSEFDQAERERCAQIILKQLEHISGMSKETLAFARGETDILLRKVFLNRFADEIREFLERDFEGKGIELKVQAGFTGVARFDEGKLKRAIYNIARNAAQAMPQGGRFTVSIDQEGEALVLRMADTGPGIPEAIADRLFESFVTAGKKDGTGLGLAIVKRVVQQHRGEVTFKSKPGKGTTFTIRLPC
ncbi:MAG: GAF domain-containing protein [Deltaproteobacteria bacterium]|nr:GAF domain-containing protein [Deltaproteobacteria bacterium]